MRKHEKGRMMVAASSRERDGTKMIAALLGILAIMVAMIFGQVVHAEEVAVDGPALVAVAQDPPFVEPDGTVVAALDTPPPTGSPEAELPVPEDDEKAPPPEVTFDVGLLGAPPPPPGTVWWPDASAYGGEAADWLPPPEYSEVAAGAGFSTQFAGSCKLTVADFKGKVSCRDTEVRRNAKGKVLLLPLVSKVETTGGGDLVVSVLLHLRSQSIPGHSYLAEMDGGDRGIKLTVAGGKGEREVSFTFVHLPVAEAKSAAPPPPAKSKKK